jgi:hypothetical protein
MFARVTRDYIAKNPTIIAIARGVMATIVYFASWKPRL